MHEYSLMRSLLKQVLLLVETHQAIGVQEVELSVGALSGVEPSLLAPAFHELSQETAAAQARLTIKLVPLEGVCEQCQGITRIEALRFLCSACGGKLRVLRGEELRVERVTLEFEEADS